MAISFDTLVIDRILSAVAEDFDGNLLYRLTQLSDATIETTSESKDAKDARGILVKKFYSSKAVNFKATNTLLDLNILGETTGSGKKVASGDSKITMPKMIIVDATKKNIVLDAKSVPITGTLKVSALYNNGTLGKSYELAVGSVASSTEFAYSSDSRTLTFPTPVDADVAQFLIKYDYEAETGIMVDQRADKFPKTIRLTLSVICCDPCSADTLRHAYIVFPSFQVSPDTSLSLTTDSGFDFSGDAQVDYCSSDKQLYYIVMSDNDEE